MTEPRDHMDEVIARHFESHAEIESASASRVLEALHAPLPKQRHSLFDRWPSLLLNTDFAPAWPRLAALACVAAFGCMVGLAAPSVQKSNAATIRIAEIDGSSLAFDPEPVIGVRP
jgi:hypothetical protein